VIEFIKRLFGKRPATSTALPTAPARSAVKTSPPRDGSQRYSGQQLGIRNEQLSGAAVRTCETLQQAGFEAYVVGGGVRDSLLGLQPKDFDVATSAEPEAIIKLFRRSRIIGRRFQIVHVMFGREVIEVTTFRAIQQDAITDEHGRVLRDNTFGNLAEDAARRDFTVNALYYDPTQDTVIDFHGGVPDLRAKTMRMIGDPATRYREDPVRMLRVARFAAKLGFTIEAGTRAPIGELAELIHNVPAARLFDEMLKLLMSGQAMACLQQLRSEGLHHGLLPLLDVILEQPNGARFVELALQRTDERVKLGKTISPGFLFATLLWHPVQERWLALKAQGEYPIPALMSAIDTVVEDQAERLAIQKRIVADMREIWGLQPRLDKRGRSAVRLLEHLRFRAGYDFMLLRCEAGEQEAELGEWWTRFIDASAEERDTMLREGTAGSGGTKKRRRRRPRGEGDSNSAGEPGNLVQ
jgi:poly(A) polymerase